MSTARLLARLPRSFRRSLWIDDSGRAVGQFYGCRITSAFQSIRGTDDAIIGYEAYARSHAGDEEGLAPWNLFARAAGDEDLVYLDRLCRSVHAINLFAQAPAGTILFANVHERLLAAVRGDHGAVYADILDALGIRPWRVAIDIPGVAESDLALLRAVAENYRRNGFAVALNRRLSLSPAPVRRIRPEFVFINASEIGGAGGYAEAIDELGRYALQAIVKRVERRAQLDAAVAAGITLASGWLFDYPGPWLSGVVARRAGAAPNGFVSAPQADPGDVGEALGDSAIATRS